jgi:hypothetical protein
MNVPITLGCCKVASTLLYTDAMRAKYTLIGLVILVLSSTAEAREPNPFGLDQIIPVKDQKCEYMGALSEGGNPFITQRLANNTYEMTSCEGNYHGTATGACPGKIILITTKTRALSKGEFLVAMGMKKLGYKVLSLNDGFTARYSYWKECDAPAPQASNPEAQSSHPEAQMHEKNQQTPVQINQAMAASKFFGVGYISPTEASGAPSLNEE